ncbi:MAG TPA: hypothetical protein VG929_10480 [Actinomycetota bacterium]|nr:hypothetical protein [Actinomycetota bacterium]
MAYLGNLTCGDCGLTFTARWGSYAGADEYRCSNDHVVHVDPPTGTLLAVDGDITTPATLAELHGGCPRCGEELRTGRLPVCPVCGGCEHEVSIAGQLG